MDLFGGIEAGGTKFVCVIGSGPYDIRAETRFPTTTPGETIARVAEFFKNSSTYPSIKAVGIGSFGPVDLHPESATWGYITTTPKPGWAHTDITGMVRDALQVPVAMDTDVNVAALGEYRWGATKDIDPCLYITVGTGIGGGGIYNGALMHGLVHCELGHIRLPHNFQRDPFNGGCPYHGDCFEGLASGPALKLRWGQSAETLPDDHPGWELEAHYISLALSDLICTLSPKRIVVGGGVMQHPRLFPLVRQEVKSLLNNYIYSPAILDNIDQYIVPPGLGSRSGVLGAIALAQQLK